MRILTRYLAREFTWHFFLALGGFSTIYLVVKFFERINAFLYNKAPLPMMGWYFLYNIPSIIFQVAPPAILLGSIVTLGTMSRHSEIMAMKAGGISLLRITAPILGVVLLIYFGLLGMNEYLVPAANQEARIMRDWILTQKKPTAAFKQSQIWIHSHQKIYNIRVYHPEKDILEGVTIYRFDSGFHLVERVDARIAQWKGGRWVFSQASKTDFPPNGDPVRKQVPELVLNLSESPADFRVAEINPDEMNHRQLRDYVHKIERDGYNADKYRTAMHTAFSFPFIAVIMAFFGIPLALRREKGAGLALGVGLSILISFLCFVVFSFCQELGKAGMLPPFMAAWLGNLIFALVSLYLFLSVRH